MTAYSPRHAVAVARAPRRPSRARRLLLALLPARKTAVPDLVPQPPAPRPYDELRCAVPGAHGMTDPYYCTLPAHHCPPPVTLTDAEIAALRPVWAVRRDGLVTVSETGEVEVYPAPLAWETSGQPTAAQPALDEEAAELARAGYVRERIPVMGERPQLEVLAAVRGALLTPGVAEAQRLAKAMTP